jgi:hypothetical protein
MNRTILVVFALLGAVAGAQAQLTIEEFSTGYSGVIGIDVQTSTNSLIVSTNYNTGAPYNFERVNVTTGAHTQFSNVSGLQSEVYPTTTKSAWGSFAEGTVFTPGGAGGGGNVYAISPDGTTSSLFTTLPDNPTAYTTARWDYTGGWNNDLIVSSESAGKAWRIDSSGTSSEIFNVPGSRPEGLLVLGSNARYGPWAGKVMALQNGGSTVYAINQNGTYQTYDLGLGDLEAIQVFNYTPTAALYVVNYPNRIWKLTGFQNVANFQEGDMLVASEFGGLFHVYWDGNQFQKQLLTNEVGQIESMVAVVPEPSTLALLGLGSVALLRRRRRS